MATITNQAKNTATLTNQDNKGFSFWSDAELTWASDSASWSGNGSLVTSQAKNTATLTNQAKS